MAKVFPMQAETGTGDFGRRFQEQKSDTAASRKDLVLLVRLRSRTLKLHLHDTGILEQRDVNVP